MRTCEEKNGIEKKAIVLQWAVWIASWLRTWKKVMGWCTAQWNVLLFCAKTIVKELHKFELARLKKKKKEKHFGHLVTFWFGTFAVYTYSISCQLSSSCSHHLNLNNYYMYLIHITVVTCRPVFVSCSHLSVCPCISCVLEYYSCVYDYKYLHIARLNENFYVRNSYYTVLLYHQQV